MLEWRTRWNVTGTYEMLPTWKFCKSWRKTREALRASVFHISSLHSVTCTRSLFFVYPVRLIPMVLWNDAKLHFGRRKYRYSPGTQPNEYSVSQTNLSTHLLKSSENGTSFKNTYGYPYLLLNRSSRARILRIAPPTSEFRASITKVALARRPTIVWGNAEDPVLSGWKSLVRKIGRNGRKRGRSTISIMGYSESEM
jgi:hypothetical protein